MHFCKKTPQNFFCDAFYYSVKMDYCMSSLQAATSASFSALEAS